MEIAEAIDSVSREKLFIDDGHFSRAGSHSLLLQWPGPPNKTRNLDGANPLYLICLTISTGGLQIIWTAIMSQGSPYLSSLGLPAYLISLVWLAGPLSGALVQPCIGVLSDRSRHPWGRRKPFIIFGTIATIVCLLSLPRTTDINVFVLYLLDIHVEGSTTFILNGAVASAWIWALNISIQPVQAGIRALIVDCCPPGQQIQANAYASCIIGIGTIVGYASGFLSLPAVLPWLGNTQFKGLCVVASVVLGSTVAVTCLMVEEKPALAHDEILKNKPGVFAVFGQILSSVKSLPRNIKRICMVQFFAWLGWFPFLFYVTTYIGNLYQAETLFIATHTPLLQMPFILHPDAIRQGTFAMTLFALTALATNFLLPLLISRTSASDPPTSSSSPPPTLSTPPTINIAAAPNPAATPASPLQPQTTLSLLWLTLPRAWTLSHILTSLLLLSTSLTRSPTPSVLLVALLGISWALTQWAPYALISAEITSRPSDPPTTSPPDNSDDGMRRLEEEDVDEVSNELEGRAGTIMAIHNMAIATPQILAAVGSSALFWLLNRWGVEDGEAVGWVMRVGGLSGFVAAWLGFGLG